MATTLGKLSTLVISTLVGGDQATESKIDRREVVLRLRGAINALIVQDYLRRKGMADDRTPSDMYLATYEVDMKDGVGRLPDGYISLPFGGGITEVHPKNKVNTQFIRENNRSVTGPLFARMGCCDDDEAEPITYDIEGYDITIDPDSKYANKTLIVKALKGAPDTIGINDPLPINPEHEFEAVNLVVQAMMPTVQIPTDMLDDQNPNRRETAR